jgi:hypothetical protein
MAGGSGKEYTIPELMGPPVTSILILKVNVWWISNSINIECLFK